MIIGVNGQLGSGKDTFYERLRLRAPQAERRAFADPLYRSAALALGVSVELLRAGKYNSDAMIYIADGFRETVVDGVLLEEPNVVADLNFRQYLQYYGTESHRDVFGQDFWVDATLPAPYSPESDWHPSKAYADKLIVVTDFRFPNEGRRIRELGGVTIKVIGLNDKKYEKRPYINEAGAPSEGWFDVETGALGHISETALLDWDFDHIVRNHVRDDNFANLDREVEVVARRFEIPLGLRGVEVAA